MIEVDLQPVVADAHSGNIESMAEGMNLLLDGTDNFETRFLINDAAVKGSKSPEFVKRMTDLGYEIVGGTPEQMASMIQDEIRRWGPIVKASGAKVD